MAQYIYIYIYIYMKVIRIQYNTYIIYMMLIYKKQVNYYPKFIKK